MAQLPWQPWFLLLFLLLLAHAHNANAFLFSLSHPSSPRPSRLPLQLPSFLLQTPPPDHLFWAHVDGLLCHLDHDIAIDTLIYCNQPTHPLHNTDAVVPICRSLDKITGAFNGWHHQSPLWKACGDVELSFFKPNPSLPNADLLRRILSSLAQTRAFYAETHTMIAARLRVEHGAFPPPSSPLSRGLQWLRHWLQPQTPDQLQKLEKHIWESWVVTGIVEDFLAWKISGAGMEMEIYRARVKNGWDWDWKRILMMMAMEMKRPSKRVDWTGCLRTERGNNLVCSAKELKDAMVLISE